MKERVETLIQERLPHFGKGKLAEACAYALTSGGKRLRPLIVLWVAEALNKGLEVSDAAFSVECFHTASLIADDLPMMDDDDERRGKPTTHKVFGEAAALLASYALIAEGYRCLTSLADPLRLQLAVETASHCTGVHGATGGQYLDLYPPNQDEATVREIFRLKTAALFELPFVLGWLFGGGAVDKLDAVKQAAEHFGIAFQLADDLDDQKTDSQNNLVLIQGESEVKVSLQKELSLFQATLSSLQIDPQLFLSRTKAIFQK